MLPILSPLTRHVIKFEGNSFVASCAMNHTSLVWLGPTNEPVQDDPHVHQELRGQPGVSEQLFLFIKPILPEDEGNWTCVDLGSNKRNTFSMTVYSKMNLASPEC